MIWQLILGGVDDMGGALFVDDIYTEIYMREWSVINVLLRTCKAAAARMTPAIMDHWVNHNKLHAVADGLRSASVFPNGVRHGLTRYMLVNCDVSAEYDRGGLTRLMTVNYDDSSIRLALAGASMYLRALWIDDQYNITLWSGGQCKQVDMCDGVALGDVLRQYSPTGDMGNVVGALLASAGAYKVVSDVC